ncbi:conserved Plasmodium protein, unknown function [Plasmodium chabaudi chabaudi]|uniref:Uncharacterized protein n=2 Tax=Plasmodium chabaudi TaxID=5825 RepID=A0A077TUG0_PLACU|nr:conserved Plasmodium protein, unknown function [Plasmodium chabaudi chabaudi]SCM11071.1 conserved Plasmodium protein, unknown function [Plasmodium chabaudi adami]SCM05996.1 conserved Plasmodium protein, unknown function [Plasmodium chabaudi chabaudi]SCM09180.1 conserved Plasmodium protein, unknown function [Plasmodium chabaudi chabaudi]SCM13068.1 conserved Plasmodium protein, unknown function [Plasmodium chabaudi adami]VTZ70525.1 conserved Plasmodium protein, unknown function [Plasmodium ch|eukprot:XP_736018.2 conserved Plasmodium protein, unknown function [Plasmodium chabaudi chabaudi]
MELLNVKDEDNIGLRTMRYSTAQYEATSDMSSNIDSSFFSGGEIPNELQSSFDDISDYILVDESDLKRDRLENTGSESNDTVATKDGTGKRGTHAQILKELKGSSFSEASKASSDRTNNNDGKKNGACRTLGTEGRKRMLKLLRKAYKYNDECKIIMKNKNPPLSISYLPYFNLSMLWQLAEDFGVYNEALKIHRECIKKRTTNVRFKGNKNSVSYNMQDIVKTPKAPKNEYMSDYLSSNVETQGGEFYDSMNTTLQEDAQGKRKRKKSAF